MQHEVVIVGMARTPIGEFLGKLSALSAAELGTIAAKEALKRAGITPEQVEDVVAGMVYKAGAKGNPARQIQLAAGIPVEAGAATVDQQCASGMRALEIACQQIQLGQIKTALVCGMESMSNVPYLAVKSRKGLRMGDGKLADGLLYDALIDVFSGGHMGLTAETLADEHGISRQAQDELALLSYDRACLAIEDGRFQDEIVPVELKTRRGTEVIDTDERPYRTSLEALGKLPPAFKSDGTVTAGNASGINDGACAMVVMSLAEAMRLGVKPLAKIRSTATFGVEPCIMGIGPVYAIPKAIAAAGLQSSDIGYYEINEAFAAQLLTCTKVLGLDMEQVNANGSGIALGHPVGCTGLRIVMAACNEAKRRGMQYACASLCAGGGPAMAVVVECLDG